MKISYKTVGGSTYTTLVDESAGGVIVDWKPKGAIAIQRDPLAVPAGATNSTFRQPMGNVTQTLPLVIQVFYTSRAAALAAIQVFTAALLTSKNHIQVIEPDPTTPTTLYYPNGICSSLDADLNGTTVQYRINLETDLVTTTAP